MKSKEGTFSTPRPMQKYLEKHLTKCLSKEEREALFKENPKPDLPVCSPPKIDKFITDFLGKKLPKEHDQDLAKTQAAILTCVRPLTAAWQQLQDQGIEQDPGITVPATEVLTLIQCVVCMIGNATEQVSQIRRTRSHGEGSQRRLLHPKMVFSLEKTFAVQSSRLWRRTTRYLRHYRSQSELKNRWNHLPRRVGVHLSGFFDRAPPLSTGGGGAEVSIRTGPTWVSGNQERTAETYSHRTFKDKATTIGFTNPSLCPQTTKPNKRSPEAITDSTRSQLRQFRNTPGHAYPKNTLSTSNRRPARLFPLKLGKSVFQLVDPRDCQSIRNRVALQANPTRLPKGSGVGCRADSSYVSRSTRAMCKRGYRSCFPLFKHICKSHVSSIQGQRVMETHHQLEGPEPVCGN